MTFAVFIFDEDLPEFGQIYLFTESVGKTELSKSEAYSKIGFKLLIVEPVVDPQDVLSLLYGGHHCVNLLVSKVIDEDFPDRNQPANTIIVAWCVKLPFIYNVK